MRCKERILLYNVSLGLSTTKRWQFFLFFCFLYLRGESGALWQNSKAGERTDVLWWLMCFSSPVKSRAPCLLHPPLSSYRVPPSILSLRVRATLQLCVWWDGGPQGSVIGMIMCHLNTLVLENVEGRMSRTARQERLGVVWWWGHFVEIVSHME